jgi:hypothetical protein
MSVWAVLDCSGMHIHCSVAWASQLLLATSECHRQVRKVYSSALAAHQA